MSSVALSYASRLTLMKLAKYKWEQQKAELGKVQKEIAMRAKKKEAFDDLKQRKNEIEADIKSLEQEVQRLEKELHVKLSVVGNIVHESVKVSNNEDDNPIVKKWGDAVAQPKWLHHYDILAKLEGYDSDRGM